MIGSAFSIASMKKTKQASKPGQKNRAPLTGNPFLDAIASSPKPEKGTPPKTFFQKEAAAVESEGRKKAYSKAKSTRGSMENAMAQVDKQLRTGSNPYDPRRMAIKSALWGTGPSPKTVNQFDLESMIRDAKAGNLSKIIERGQSNRDRRAGFQDAMDQASAEPQPDTGIMGLIDRLGVEKAMQIIDVVGGYKQGGIGGAMSGASHAMERLTPTNLARAGAEGYAGGRDFRANPDESMALKLGIGIGNLAEYMSPIGPAKVANDVINTAGQVISRKSLKPVYESLIEAPIEGVKTALDPSKPIADRILGGLGTAAMAFGAAHGVRKGIKIAKNKGWIGVTDPESNVGATLTKEVNTNGKGQEKGQVENPVLNWSVGPLEAPAAIPKAQPVTKVKVAPTLLGAPTDTPKAQPLETSPRRTGLTPEIMVDYYDTVGKGGVDADLKSGEPRQLFAGDLPDSVTTKAKRGVDPYSKIARGEGVQVVEGSGATDYSGAYYGKTKTKPYGEIRFTPGADDITRAHEVAHAIDAVTSPTGRTGRTLYEILGASQGEQKVIRNEMLDITKRLVGESEFNSNPKYYSKPAELWARFLQAHAQNPLLVDSYAPRSAELLDSLAKKHPAISTYLDVAKGKPLEGKVRALAPDKRQQYRKDLGDYLGNKAYSADVGYKAAAEHETHRIGEIWRSMAEGVKDSPKDLMIAAEGVKTNAGGKFEFGTTDRVVTTKESEAAKLEDMGYELTDSIVDANGGEKFVYTRTRYTPDEAKANYEKLTPEGKRVIDQWTKTRSEATSEFNRHVQAELAQIDETVEGYVSHVLQQNKTASQWAKSFFKTRTAGFRKHRTGAEGYVEDFWKQTQYQAATSALEKLWNVHMPKQLARVAERVPLDEVRSPAERKGWTLVEGNLETGLYEVALHKFKHGATRYWIPNTVWDAYKIGTGQMEVAGAAKIAQGAMRYWSLNVLAHPGSITTNAVSGGMQLGTKWIEDFYLDALGEKGTRNRTKSNLKAVLKVMSKGGWKETPDWVYGGKMGGMHGIFDIESTGFWHKVMGPYRAVEDFYKRIIARAELDKMGVSVKDLESLLKKSEIDEFNRIIGEIDKSVDAAAYNYQNVPGWLSNSKYSTAKSLVKPFAIYPYKAIKQFIRPFEMLADGNYSANEKAAAMLAMATVVSTYVAAKRRINAGSNLDTRAGDEKLAGANRRLQARGGVVVGKNKGEERVINLSKYTPLNFAEMVDSLVPARQKDGQWGVDIDQLQSAITDLIGGVGPAAQVAGEVAGMRSKYDAYKSSGAVVGGAVGSFIPFARIQKDINDLIGVKGKAVRKVQPKTFSEALLQNIAGLDQRKARKDYKGVSENIRAEVLHRLLMGLRERYINPIEQREAISRNKVNKAKNEGR